MRNSNLSYWPVEIQEELRKNFSYDAEKGEVRRVVPPARGPRQRGAVGSVTSNGELVMTIKVLGKQTTFRMAKVAVLLATGKQYKNIAFKDGNRMNLKWDNLVPIGEPLTEEDNNELVNEIVKSRIDNFLKQKIEANKPTVKEVQAKQTQEKQPEKLVDYQKVWQEINDEKVKLERAYLQHPQLSRYRIVHSAFEKVFDEEQTKYGIWTGMFILQANSFLKAAANMLGKTVEQCIMERPENLAEEPKWVQDLYIYATRLKPGLFDEATQQMILDKYLFNDQQVPPFSGELSYEMTKKYLEQIAALDKEFGNTEEGIKQELATLLGTNKVSPEDLPSPEVIGLIT